MKTRECIKCEKMFECEGKEKDKPCLHFKERQKYGEIQKQESRIRRNGVRQY